MTLKQRLKEAENELNSASSVPIAGLTVGAITFLTAAVAGIYSLVSDDPFSSEEWLGIVLGSCLLSVIPGFFAEGFYVDHAIRKYHSKKEEILGSYHN